MEKDEKISFGDAYVEYLKRFGRVPVLSPDGGPSAEEIMHAALTGIDLDENEHPKADKDVW